jgi:pSer/pThr/pTyr-binding forkhead associated (FHA) protein
MQVRLEVASHNKANVKRVVLQSDAIIGRGADCNLRIASNQVSRQHCKVIVTDTQVLVRDLASSNGTFVNGQLIPPQKDVPLESGAQLSVGPANFIVRFDAPAKPAEPEPAAPEYPPVSLRPSEPASTVELPVVTADMLQSADPKSRDKGSKSKPKVVPGTAAVAAALQTTARAAEQAAPRPESAAPVPTSPPAVAAEAAGDVFLQPGMHRPGSTVFLTPLEKAEEPAALAPSPKTPLTAALPTAGAAAGSLAETVDFKIGPGVDTVARGPKESRPASSAEAAPVAQVAPVAPVKSAATAAPVTSDGQTAPPNVDDADDEMEDEQDEYEDDEQDEYEDDEEAEQEYEDEEEEERPAKKRGGLFSLFGLLGGKRKKRAQEEDYDEDDEEEQEDEEYAEEDAEDESEVARQEPSKPAGKPAATKTAPPTPPPTPVPDGASEDDIASFLTGVDPDAAADNDDEDLGDFLKGLGN